jgi:hypothetical protein
MIVLLLAACQPKAEQIEGKVVDIWGGPIPGATVMMVGGTERPLTDDQGHYAMPRVEGAHLMKAGAKGYIQDHADVEIQAGEPAAGPIFTLYPKPDEAGFHLVATGHYEKLDHKLVHSVGNTLRSYRGIRTTGDAMAETSRPKVVFHTELRHDEIMRLGLTLHRLEYLRDAEVPSPLGKKDVAVNLYVDAGEIPTDLQPLRSKTDYLLQPVEPLEPGVYAFQTQDLLAADAEETGRFEQIPEELRVVFPFEVR